MRFIPCAAFSVNPQSSGVVDIFFRGTQILIGFIHDFEADSVHPLQEKKNVEFDP
jgi:hypothetical protein